MRPRARALFTVITGMIVLMSPFSARGQTPTLLPPLPPQLHDLQAGKAQASGVIPDVKANGADAAITITRQASLSLTVALNPGPRAGQPADWYILLQTPWAWYYYDVNKGWQEGFARSYAGPIFAFAQTTVLTISGLPEGSYVFYFLLVFPDASVYDAVGITVTGTTVGQHWVHVEYLGNYIWPFLGVPTAHMQLVAANGARLQIEPWGCITLSGSEKNYVFSAWGIDQVSSTPPPDRGKICGPMVGHDPGGQDRCIAEWYPVNLPAGFTPVKYVAGCFWTLPIDF